MDDSVADELHEMPPYPHCRQAGDEAGGGESGEEEGEADHEFGNASPGTGIVEPVYPRAVPFVIRSSSIRPGSRNSNPPKSIAPIHKSALLVGDMLSELETEEPT